MQCTWFVEISKALFLCLERTKFGCAIVCNGMITGVAHVQLKVSNS